VAAITAAGMVVTLAVVHSRTVVSTNKWPLPSPTYPASPARVGFEDGLDTLAAALDSLTRDLHSARLDRARRDFALSRQAYKRVECLLEVIGPSLSSELNGPLPEDNSRPLGAPAAFAIVESGLFDHEGGDDSVRATADGMRDAVRTFRGWTTHLRVDDSVLLDALRREIARVTTLGLAGFDSERTQDAVLESSAAFEGMRTLALAASPAEPASGGWAAIDSTLAAAAAYLGAHPDFTTLDRLTFIVGYANPAAEAVQAVRRTLPAAERPIPRLWRSDAATVFERDAFDASAFAPKWAPAPSPAIVSLGRRLFFDARMSGPGTRSCAFCHDPARAFTDGRARSPTLVRPPRPPRNTPTLLNAAYEPVLFLDGRAPSLEAQAEAVLGSPGEMGSSEALAAHRLQTDSAYRHAFAASYPDSPDTVSGLEVRMALAAYVRSLTALDSRFDRATRGDTSALKADERRGFTVFMGKGRCGTCHYLPLFNGTVPPDFSVSDPEIIGVPVERGLHVLDPDPGRAGVDRWATHRAAFRVPTLRNIALTAPYMHNGAFATLDQVIDFYDRGGGAGTGVAGVTPTLPATKLHLSRQERADLRALRRSRLPGRRRRRLWSVGRRQRPIAVE
jgi:cytochrome c peroxidase